ncbi:hypothetical protein HDV00_011732 [Rhizophlyctis rosea]|nr:hypothetical protein HDV00_011732 [Rhizophlyctis rosea]
MQLSFTTVATSLLALAASVQGHASMTPNAAVPNTNYYGAVRIPHGCTGSPSNNITVWIPQNVTSVKPKTSAVWQIATTIRPLVPPVIAESGATVNTTIDTITWTGSKVADTEYFDFEFSGKLPDGKDGDIIYFTVLQLCENGASYLWATSPGNNVSDNTPNRTVSTAPKLTLFLNGTSIKAQPQGSGASGASADSTQKSGAGASAVGSLMAGAAAAVFGVMVYFM